MTDLDYLRKVYSNYTTDELIEYILLKTDDLVPEALSVVKEEFHKREGDINDLIKTEALKSGVNENVINEVQYLAPKCGTDKVIGNFYLTSNSIFFIPFSIAEQPIPYGFFVYKLGPLGLIFDELNRKLCGKGVNTDAKDAKDIKLPLNLLIRYIKHSYGKNIENIKSITYWKHGDLSIVGVDGKTAGFIFDKTKIPKIETWVSTHKIRTTIGKGFFDLINI
jgi:hypothetical protein